jgi:hypothetical protein
MVSDHDRDDLYVAVVESLGAGAADTLMELLPPVGWTDVARKSDIAELRGEMAELRGEMAQLRAHVDGQLPKLISANVASMVGIAGLVFAVARIA